MNARIILTFPETSRKIFPARHFIPTNDSHTPRPAIYARRLAIFSDGPPFHATDEPFHASAQHLHASARHFIQRRNIARDGVATTYVGTILHVTERPKFASTHSEHNSDDFSHNYELKRARLERSNKTRTKIA